MKNTKESVLAFIEKHMDVIRKAPPFLLVGPVGSAILKRRGALEILSKMLMEHPFESGEKVERIFERVQDVLIGIFNAAGYDARLADQDWSLADKRWNEEKMIWEPVWGLWNTSQNCWVRDENVRHLPVTMSFSTKEDAERYAASLGPHLVPKVLVS